MEKQTKNRILGLTLMALTIFFLFLCITDSYGQTDIFVNFDHGATAGGGGGGAGSGDVTGVGGSVDNNFPMYLGTSGKFIEDSGISSGDVILGPVSAVDSNFAFFDGITGKLIKDLGLTTTDFVTAPTPTVIDNVTTFSSTVGQVKDSGVLISDLMTRFSPSIDENIVIFDGTDGDVKDSLLNIDQIGALIPDPLPAARTQVDILKNIIEFTDVDTPIDSSGIKFFTGDITDPSQTPIEANKGSLFFIEGTNAEEMPLMLKMDDGLSQNWQAINASTNYVTGDFITRGEVKTFGVVDFRALTNFTLTGSFLQELVDGQIDFVGLPSLTTCVETGGGVSFNVGNPDNLDVEAGIGVIVEFSVFPGEVEKFVQWSATNDIVLPTTNGFNTVFVDINGTVGVASGVPDGEFSRENIILSVVNPGIDEIVNRQGSCLDHGNDLRSLSLFINLMVKDFQYNGNANQTIAHAAGQLYAYGVVPKDNESNINEIGAANPVTFKTMTATTTISSSTTVVDTMNFDPDGAGILTSLANGVYSYYRIWLDANGDTILQYGQSDFPTLSEVVIGEEVDRPEFITNNNLINVYQYQATVYFKEGTTDLTSESDAALINGGLFGVGSAGTGSAGTTGGDVSGPASSDDENIVIFDGLSGKVIKDSGVDIDELGKLITQWIALTDFNEGDIVFKDALENRDLYRVVSDFTSSALFETDFINGDLRLVSAQTLGNGTIGGGDVTIATATTVDVTTGSGIIIDNYSTPSLRDVKPIQWSETLGLDITLITPVNNLISVLVNDSGIVFLQGGAPNFTDAKNFIILDFIIVGNTGEIEFLLEHSWFAKDTNNQLQDTVRALGTFNINGNVYSAFSITALQRSAGQIHGWGANPDNHRQSNIKDQSAEAPVSIEYADRSEFAGTQTTIVDTVNFDNGNGLANLGLIQTNRFGYSRISEDVNGQTYIQYGQQANIGRDLTEATLGVCAEPFIINPTLNSPNVVVDKAIIVYLAGADVNDAENFVFIPADRWGTLCQGSGDSASQGGDVLGPVSSVDNSIPVFDGLTGKIIKDNSTIDGGWAIDSLDNLLLTYNCPGGATCNGKIGRLANNDFFGIQGPSQSGEQWQFLLGDDGRVFLASEGVANIEFRVNGIFPSSWLIDASDNSTFKYNNPNNTDGNGIIGEIQGVTNHFAFGNANSGTYAIRQFNLGGTDINSAADQNITFKEDNINYATLDKDQSTFYDTQFNKDSTGLIPKLKVKNDTAEDIGIIIQNTHLNSETDYPLIWQATGDNLSGGIQVDNAGTQDADQWHLLTGNDILPSLLTKTISLGTTDIGFRSSGTVRWLLNGGNNSNFEYTNPNTSNGNGQIGTIEGHINDFSFGNSTSGTYALRHSNTGKTVINSASGQTIQFRIGNNTSPSIMTIDASAEEFQFFPNESNGNGLVIGHQGGNIWYGIKNIKSGVMNSNYALIQNNSGHTLINASSGQSLGFRINNSEIFRVDTTLILEDKNGNGYIVNQSNTRTRFLGAKVACSSNSCTKSSTAGDGAAWIESVTRVNTGEYNVNIVSGIYSNEPICTVAAISGIDRWANIRSASTSNRFVFVGIYEDGTAVNRKDGDFTIICVGKP